MRVSEHATPSSARPCTYGKRGFCRRQVSQQQPHAITRFNCRSSRDLRRRIPRNPSRRVASTGQRPSPTTYPPLKMTTLDPEPFGEPTLLPRSPLLSDTNDTTTFIPNGLLDTGLFDGTGDGGEGGNASSAQSLPWASRTDGIGAIDDDGLSTFMSNGLLDAPTQTTSTAICSDHLHGICRSRAVPRT